MQLEERRRGGIVDGNVLGGSATLISAETMGADAVEISCRTRLGDVGLEALDADAAPLLSAGSGDSQWTRDAGGDPFRLGPGANGSHTACADRVRAQL